MSGGSYVLAGDFWPVTSWCIVNLPDLARFTAQWLVSAGFTQADFNNSGKVNLFDYHTLTISWRQSDHCRRVKFTILVSAGKSGSVRGSKMLFRGRR